MPRTLISLFSLLPLFFILACIPREQAPAPVERPHITTTPPAAANPAIELPVYEPEPPKVFNSRINADTPSIKVGLLVPLSGESSELGKSMLDAATLALYDYYLPLQSHEIGANIVLVPKDTGGSPASVTEATQQVVDQNAQLIIGPIFTKPVGYAAPVARRSGVPLISLSNNRAAATSGMYLFGFLPELQVQRMAEYLVQQRVTSVAAILPNDAYGETIGQSLRETLSSRGIGVSPVEFYSRTNENLTAAATRLKQSYSRAPFQALFIADGNPYLQDVLSALKLQGLNSQTVRFIGTGLWDEPDVHNNPDMQGAWFTSSPPAYYKAFEKRFMSAYGYRPARLSSLAYDAVTLAAALAIKGNSANFDPTVLSSRQGFIGPANGLYRLKDNGISQRGLAVMEIESGKTKTLDAAPTSFLN